MIGVVVVSHSAALAEAAVELAMQMVHDDRPPVRLAAGADGGFGTDAAAIADAIDEVADDGAEGIVIITDLGSAVLSAELALDLRGSSVPVRISDGPFVEGLTAGIVRAATGGSLDEVVAETDAALTAKQPRPAAEAPHPEPPAPVPADATAAAAMPASSPDDAPDADATADATLRNPMGLHSRPAALVVKAVAPFDAHVTVSNATTGSAPASAASMIALLALGAAEGHRLQISAVGREADEAVEAVRALVVDGFGELP